MIAFSLYGDIYTATLDYTGTYPQLSNLAPVLAANTASIDTHPTWVDNETIIFESERNGIRELYQYTSNSGGAQAASAPIQAAGVLNNEFDVTGGSIQLIVAQAGQPGVAVAQTGCFYVHTGTNIRDIPSPDGDIIQVEIGTSIFPLGIYQPDPDDENVWWVYVEVNNENGWQSHQLFYYETVVDARNGFCPQNTLPMVDENGDEIILATPTPTATATPFATPTLYPTATQGTPNLDAAPQELCDDEQLGRQWLTEICHQGWGYLNEIEKRSLINAITANPDDFDTYIEADSWWLENIVPRRGINDVPPAYWDVSCDNAPVCTSIVSNASYLFDNMTRIGVDTQNSAGNGQRRNDNGVVGEFVLGIFSPDPIWGRSVAQDPYDPNRLMFACGNNRLLEGVTAGVCWVCQDLPTELYRAAGFDLQTSISQTSLSSSYSESESRYVPSVYDYLVSSGSMPNPGNLGTYPVGDMVMLVYNPNTAQDLYTRYFHVGIVVRNYDGTTGQHYLDEVLVAQISFSSQGFFQSNSDLDNYSEPGFGGRYEVITLRNYLFKHAYARNEQIPLSSDENYNSESERLAGIYIAHGRPIELGN